MDSPVAALEARLAALRSACRHGFEPDLAMHVIGFRVVMRLP